MSCDHNLIGGFARGLFNPAETSVHTLSYWCMHTTRVAHPPWAGHDGERRENMLSPGVATGRCVGGCRLALVSGRLSRLDKSHTFCSAKSRKKGIFLLPDPLRPDVLEPGQKTQLLHILSGEGKRHLSCVEWWSRRRLSTEAEMDRKVLVQIAGETDRRHAPSLLPGDFEILGVAVSSRFHD